MPVSETNDPAPISQPATPPPANMPEWPRGESEEASSEPAAEPDPTE